MKIKSHQIDFEMGGNTETLREIISSLRMAYTEAGMDMPKRLNDAVFDIECNLQPPVLELQDENDLKEKVVEAAIAFAEKDGCSGTDCDLKNAVEEYVELKRNK